MQEGRGTVRRTGRIAKTQADRQKGTSAADSQRDRRVNNDTGRLREVLFNLF